MQDFCAVRNNIGRSGVPREVYEADDHRKFGVSSVGNRANQICKKDP